MSAASHGHRPSVGRKGGGRFPHRPVWRNITRRRKTARRKELTSARAILKTIGPGSGWFITAAKPRPMSVRLAMALAMGMVHVVTDGPVLPHALALAREYAAIALLTFAHIKRLIRQEAEKPLEDGLTMERTLFLDFLVSDDANKLMKRMNDGALDIREVPQGE